MTDKSLSRRQFLNRAAVVGAVGAGSALLAACGGGAAPADGGASTSGDGAASTSSLSCTDAPDLTDADRQTRTALKYVDASDVADQNCTNCVQFETGGEGVCGKCKVLPGPVNPVGHCSVWAAKPS